MQTSKKAGLGLATLAAIGAIAMTAPAAHAQVNVYTTRASFDAALAAAGATSSTNTFSTVPPTGSDQSSVAYPGNGFNYTATGQNNGVPGTNNDVFVDGSTITPYYSSGNVIFNVNAGKPVYAFGGDFYATTFATGTVPDPGQTISINYSGGANPSYQFTSGPDASDASAFRGFISATPFTYFSELVPTPPSAVANNDYATVDNLEVAAPAPVPEPSETLALGLGVLCLSSLILKAHKRHRQS